MEAIKEKQVGKRPSNLDISGVMSEIKTEKIIGSIVNEIITHVCNKFEMEIEPEMEIEKKQKPKNRKKVRFAEDTKTHDGPEFAKQVAEFIVYTCFEKRKISTDKSITLLLNQKYGCGYIDRKVADRVMELLTTVYDKLQVISIYNRRKTVQLFRNTTGKYGLKFGKIHQTYLGKLIRLCKVSFQNIN